MEQENRAKEELIGEIKLEDIVLNTPDHIFAQDGQLRYLYVANPQLGLTEKDMIGKTDHDFLPKNDAEKLTAIKRKVLDTGKAVQVELPLISRKGKPEYFSGSYVPRFDNQGKISGLFGYFRNVTSQKETEKALKESEKRFNSIADNAGEWIWETDAQGRYIYCSPAVEKILGYKPQEMLGKYFYDTFPPEIKEEFKKAALDVFSRKEPFSRFSNQNIHKDGHTVILETSGVPLVDTRGNLTGYRGVDYDVTEVKKAEKELQEKQAQLDLALQSANMGIWSLDIKNNLRSFDQLTCNILGINPENFKRSPQEFYSIVHPDDLDKVKQEMSEAIVNGELYEPEYRVIWPDGTLHYIASRGKVHYDPVGRPEKITGVIWDITRSRQAEESLSLQRKFTETVLENIEAGVVVCNGKGELILFNQIARQWHGLGPLSVSQEDWAGRYDLYFEDGVTPMDIDTVPLARAFRGEIVHDASMVIAAKDQPKRNIVAHAGPIKSEDGRILGAVAVMHDITAMKKVEVELKQRLRELEIFNKAAVGREERIIELKKEVDSFKKKLME